MSTDHVPRPADDTKAEPADDRAAEASREADGREHDEPERSKDVAGARTRGTAARRGPETKAAPAIPRALLAILGLAATWVTLQGAREVKDLLAPVLLALTLVITAYPIIGMLHKLGVPRIVGALCALMVLYLVAAGLFFSFGFSVAQLAAKLPDYQDEFNDMWKASEEYVQARIPADSEVAQNFTIGWDEINPERVFPLATGLLSSLAGASSILILMLTVMMFMVMDTVNMEQRMERLRRSKPALADGFEQFAQGVRSYWLVTTVFGLIVAVLDYFAFIWLGVPLALTWALFSFVTNYIPTVGLVIGIVPPAALALVENGPTNALWVVVVMLLINNIIQTFIQPKFTGDAVGITATAAFLSLVFWSYVLGGLGAILAVPMTLAVKCLLVDIDPAARWANALLSNDPETARTPKRDTHEETDPQKPDDDTSDDEKHTAPTG